MRTVDSQRPGSRRGRHLRRWPALVLAALLVGAPTSAWSDLAGPAATTACALSGFDDKCESWAAVYDNEEDTSPYGWDEVMAVVPSPAGDRVYAAGNSQDARSQLDWVVLAYEASTGQEKWRVRYDGPGRGDDIVGSVVVSADGRVVYVTGVRDYSVDDVTLLVTGALTTVAYDAASGKVLWAASVPNSGCWAIGNCDIALSADGGRLYVAGSTGPHYRDDQKYLTVAYDAKKGRMVWSAVYGREGNGWNVPARVGRSLAVSGDGTSVFVTGTTGRTSIDAIAHDHATVAYDARRGTQLWDAVYAGVQPGSNDRGVAIGASPDGSRVYVTGESGPEDADYATLAYDTASGRQLWLARYPDNSQWNLPYALAVGTDDRVYVTGSVRNTSNTDFGTIAYEGLTGKRVWEARYEGGGDSGWDIGVSPNGTRVFVTGPSGGYAATVAYDAADGGQKWSARYQGPANDAWGVRMGVSGTQVFVGAFLYYWKLDPDPSSPSINDVNFGILAYDSRE